jgi:two-component system sensor histidine kinase MprB
VTRARTLLRPRRWSVRTRLAAVSTVSATIGLSVAGVAAYVVTSRVLHEQVDDSLRTAPASKPFSGPDSPSDPGPDTGPDAGPDAGPAPADLCSLIESARAPSPGLFTVELIRADGTVCQDPESPALVLVPSDFERAGGRTESTELRDGSFDNGDRARVAIVLRGDGDVLLIGRDIQPTVNVLHILGLALAGVTVLGAAIALLLSRWSTGAALRPITRFARVAEQIAETGSLDHEPVAPVAVVEDGRGDELDRLAHAFTKMTSVLADAQLRQRRLVADAGHELRTPLSSLRANIELLRKTRLVGRGLPEGEEGRLLDDLSSQAIELSSLIDDLAELAASGSTVDSEEPVRWDLCVERALHRARSRAADHAFDVALSPWLVTGDAASLERAAVNLLDNAIKFSPPRTTIDVTLEDGTLRVADHGTGVSGDEGRHAFERFWRSPRARALPGSGLGLSIVDDVARHHGGWASLEPRPGGGSVASLHVPGRPTT